MKGDINCYRMVRVPCRLMYWVPLFGPSLRPNLPKNWHFVNFLKNGSYDFFKTWNKDGGHQYLSNGKTFLTLRKTLKILCNCHCTNSLFQAFDRLMHWNCSFDLFYSASVKSVSTFKNRGRHTILLFIYSEVHTCLLAWARMIWSMPGWDFLWWEGAI